MTQVLTCQPLTEGEVAVSPNPCPSGTTVRAIEIPEIVSFEEGIDVTTIVFGAVLFVFVLGKLISLVNLVPQGRI